MAPPRRRSGLALFFTNFSRGPSPRGPGRVFTTPVTLPGLDLATVRRLEPLDELDGRRGGDAPLGPGLVAEGPEQVVGRGAGEADRALARHREVGLGEGGVVRHGQLGAVDAVADEVEDRLAGRVVGRRIEWLAGVVVR